MPMDTLWLLPALACYALSAALFVFDRLSGRTQATGYAAAILGAGVVFHAFDLTARGLQAGNIPVANFAQALSFLAWLTALAGLLMIVRLRLAVIGAFVAPAVTLALGAASLTMSSGHVVLPAALRSVWLPIHVTLAILGYTMFVLAASVSIAYLAYESRLKSKRAIGPANEGAPSLEKLDRINYRLLGWGFIMLELGDRERRDLGRRDVGPFLVMGAQGILVAGDLGALRGSARIPPDDRMARAARRGAHFSGVQFAGWFVRGR